MKDDLLKQEFLNSFQTYADNSQIRGLWDWQKVIAGSVLHLYFVEKSNILVEVATGHGKSVLICAIARAIYN